MELPMLIALQRRRMLYILVDIMRYFEIDKYVGGLESREVVKPVRLMVYNMYIK